MFNLTSLKYLQHLCNHHKDEHEELQVAKKLVSPPSHSSQSKQITIPQSFSHAIGYGSMCAIIAVLTLIFIFTTADSLRCEAIDNALVKMLVLDMQSANIVHNKGFSRLSQDY